jgi:hypothetical protein
MQVNTAASPETSSESPASCRFRFSLRTLLIATTIAALVSGIATKEIVRHVRATRVAAKVRGLGGAVHWNSEVLETLLRDQALTRITDVYFTNPSFPSEQWTVLKDLPQRFGLQVEGKQFTDDSLDHLKGVSKLRYLVLNNTGVTDAGVAELKRSLPNLRIMFGYPGDSNFREIP